MTFFRRPLGDRIHRPLTVAVVWAFVAAIAALMLTIVVGGLVAFALLVRSWFGDAPVALPWGLVRAMAAALAPLVVATSTWAATYGSAERHTVQRALVGAAVGIAVLAVVVRISAFEAVFAAFGWAWAVAVPFERWARVAARVTAVTVAALGAALATAEPSGGVLVGVVIAAPPAAAIAVWVGDGGWRLVTRRSGAASSPSVAQEGERGEAGQQGNAFPPNESPAGQ